MRAKLRTLLGELPVAFLSVSVYDEKSCYPRLLIRTCDQLATSYKKRGALSLSRLDVAQSMKLARHDFSRTTASTGNTSDHEV